ncbi:MAG: DNA methyltransferase [Desulfobacula sp.]|jgi:DNA modification methylase|nr:DNA methyltransferase [Desulfobacula sp.]
MNKNESLFKTKTVPGKPGSGNMFEEEFVHEDGPVTCLGKEFKNDQARREYFTGLLRQKLKDPDFRKIEGFPIGEDEDILALSDPPYYTACPNPWLIDFVAEWEAQKPVKPKDYQYHREPFAADVSEGKNNPIYNAHSYHTKVPHKAIMRYVLHYTEPGDIVFDGFCGTGMTGVAAQMCGDRDVVQSLGYQVKPDGTILQEETGEDGEKAWKPFSKLGTRKAVLNDLSPVATFIAYNYNSTVDIKAFEQEAKRILSEVEDECGWMYETKHSDGRKARINYTVWSDVFVCPECASEIVFWDAAVNKGTWQVNDALKCSTCGTQLGKRNLERSWVSHYDTNTGVVAKLAKQIPVLIHYKLSGSSYTKKPDDADIGVIHKISNSTIPYWYPIDPLPDGDKMSDPRGVGIQNASEFYTKRALYNLAKYSDLARASNLNSRLLVNLTSSAIVLSRQYRFRSQGGNLGAGGGPMNGTLYVPSLLKEIPVIKVIGQHIERRAKVLHSLNKGVSVIQTGSLSSLTGLPDNSIDYLFIDPPFGSNIMYSELNYLWESWLRVKTNEKEEAIENRHQKKGSSEYRQLMAVCFSETYRILKPGRWMTVEFSNTKAAVWNSIQTSLTEAGFIVANIAALDKKQGSFNAVNNPTSVKQDLVISAYKPNGGFEDRFKQEAQTEEGVWDFVRTHLKYLPVIKKQGLDIVAIPERDPRILYDQVITYYVLKGYNVPIDSQDFQLGLSQRFSERDGMLFLPEQVAEYDRKKMIGGGRPLQQSLFISDETSAIEWLRNLLRDKPQSSQDINPKFMKEISGWRKNEVGLELSILLEQNFLPYDGKGDVPSQIHSHLSTWHKELRNLPKKDPALMAKAKGRWYVPDPNKTGDLEKLREKALLKEFETYKLAKKKLKIFRLEAVRAGFKKAWQEKDYAVIVAVAEKIPNNVLEEDPKLLMWYNLAVTRTEDSGGGL